MDKNSHTSWWPLRSTLGRIYLPSSGAARLPDSDHPLGTQATRPEPPFLASFSIEELYGQPIGRDTSREDAVVGSYSYLSAAIGSTEDARRAGIKAAKAAVITNTKVTAVKISGFWTLPSAHFDSSRLERRLRTTPHTTPPITCVPVEARTRFTTLPRVAPSAIRMPNSSVLCATL